MEMDYAIDVDAAILVRALVNVEFRRQCGSNLILA